MDKLRAVVVYCTSEAEEYPAAELTSHNPNTKGWQSQRLCGYPQELIFQFEGPVHITKIQILSHESKISSKIELFMGDLPKSGPSSAMGEEMLPEAHPSYQSCEFKRLGYLSLDSNQQSRYKARELKTVRIDTVGIFLKLVVHKCYVNEFNLFNQVGIIGVRFIGNLIQRFSPRALTSLAKASNNSNEPPPDLSLRDIRPIPDIREEMTFDPLTAQKINELMMFKEKAVQREDFLEAKRIKEQIDNIKRNCARLVELEDQKRLAVEREDYDRAAFLKEEIAKVRNNGLYGANRISSASSSSGRESPGTADNSARGNTRMQHHSSTDAGPSSPAFPTKMSKRVFHVNSMENDVQQ